MKELLKLIHGKKTSIGVIAGLFIVFAIGRGYIDQDTAELLSGVMAALGLSANYATRDVALPVNPIFKKVK